MIATHNQRAPNEDIPLNLTPEMPEADNDTTITTFNPLTRSSQLLLTSQLVTHTPKAGLNPLVDAAGYLLSIAGKLKQLNAYRQLTTLQKELIQEVNTFQENITPHYNAEYIVVCRFILCATLDDIISNTTWGSQGHWESHSLLSAFNQDAQHQDKFFTIMERAIKEPAVYIDLMELMYICLSIGYKGQYRSTEHSQYQLEQITNTLYKHIRAYRGSFSKILSPTPLKMPKLKSKAHSKSSLSLLYVFLVTACVIMTIFVSLGYLMDVISNEAYQHISQIQKPVSSETSKQ